MDFALIGTISSYTKLKNLTFAAKHKIRTGQTLTNSNGNLVSVTTSTFDKLREAAQASSDKAKQAKLRRIKQKLMNGRKLSEEEMGFLRVNDTKLYKKAKHAEEAREELKAELKKAKSKSEAREAMTRAMIKASTEAMAELGALGQCNGNTSGGSMSTGGDAMNISASAGGEFSSTENVSGSENQTLSEVNQAIETSGEKATGEVSQSTHEKLNGKQDNNKTSAQKFNESDKTQMAQPTYGAEDIDTPEDIMEKFIMTIRALEDEWAHFSNSDEYKNLPEGTLEDNKKVRKQVTAPNQKFLDAVALYRKSMHYQLYT